MQALQSWAPMSIWTNRPDRHACSAPRPAIDMSGLKRKWNDEFVDNQRLVDQAPAKRMRMDDSHSRHACAQTAKESHDYTLAQPNPSAQVQASGGKDEVDATTTPAAADAVGIPTPPSSNRAATTEHVSSKLEEARKCIEAQLNLEILLRHQELRLIEQELAKAQVSLEQLRRCHVIPFPGTPGSTATFDQISDGTGPALEPTLGHTRPPNPAPWGATDGPYSQHYARWLIPDDSFDSTSQSLPKARLSPGGKSYTPTDARGLRGSERDNTVANRRQRQSVSLKTNVTLATGALPKERPTGPLKLKRSDGVWVKLVCRHCQKEDVNSVQGFLNHCRIAHSDTMRTHQEAAAAHGVVLEDDEVAPTLTPTLVRQTPVSATFGNNWATQPAQVHSLNAVNRRLNSQPSFTTPTRPSPLHFTDGSSEIESSLATPRTASYQPSPAKASSHKSTQQSKVMSNELAGSAPSAQRQRHVATSPQNPSFKGSSDTPLLSALAQKRGYGMDLAKLVTSAQQKIDLEQVESSVGDNDDEDETARPAAVARPTMPTQSTASTTRMPRQPSPLMQSTSAPATATQLHPSTIIPNSVASSFDPVDAPSATKDPYQRSALKTPSPQSAAAPIVADSQIHDLSPRTAESNPGMVTDREDDLDDEDDDNEEYEEVPDSDCDEGRDDGHIRVGGSQHSVRIRGEDDIDMRDPDDVDNANEAKLPLAQEAARSATQSRSGAPRRIKRAAQSKQARPQAGLEGKQEE